MSRLNERLFIFILLVVISGGVVMRVVLLGDHPYGLYQDEAINGLDAIAVWEGHTPLYFAANNGREPFFIYLMAGTIRMFGRTTAGLRAAAALAGIATLTATYFLGKTWVNRRVGLLSAAILAAMLWHVQLSRVGFRAVTLPLWTALALGMGALALQRQSRNWAFGAGAAYGFAFYTYSPARFTPLALVLILVYGVVWHRAYVLERWRLVMWMVVAGVIVMLPLGILTVTQPELVLGRSGQVAIWNESVNQGHFPATLLGSTRASLGMFTFRGDDIWRHNVPDRPVFDPLMAIVFAIGLVMTIARWQRQPVLALALIWTLCLLLPTLLAEDAPHFLRAVGVLPVVVLIPAVALDDMVIPTGNLRGTMTLLGAALLVLISGLIAAFDYFGCRISDDPIPGFNYEGCYRENPIRGYFFQAEATQLAEAINAEEGTVYVDRRFWDTFPSIRYLVGERDGLVLFDEGDTLSEGQAPFSLFVWPHVDYQGALKAIPVDEVVTVEVGPMTRGDLEAETYTLYVALFVDELAQNDLPAARFANGFTLNDIRTESTDEGIAVIVAWTLDEPLLDEVRFFAHAVTDDDQTIVAQVDEPPGTVYYPPLSWSHGSVIIQRVLLTGPWPDGAPTTLRLGMYNPTNNERYGVTSDSMSIDHDAIVLPLVIDRSDR